jgi:RHS repeat-associated protein
MQSLRPTFLLALILLTVASVFGQTQPNLENGYKAYGSYDGSNIDTINTMNGNLMLHLPMPFSYPQRGGKLGLANLLTVSSKNWAVQCDPTTTGAQYPLNCYWTLGGRLGALIAEAGSGVGLDHTLDLSLHRTTTTENDSYGTTYDASGYSLSTADGATHQLYPSFNTAMDSNGDALSYDASDLSGYHVDLRNPDEVTGIPAAGTIVDRNGNRYEISGWAFHCGKPVTNNNLNGNTTTVTCVQWSHTGSITDVNGNVLTLSGSSVSDTMGRPFSSRTGTTPTTDFTGCVSSTWPLDSATLSNYAAFNSTGSAAPNQIKLCYANVSIQTAFGISTQGINGAPIPITEAPGGLGVPNPYIVPMVVTAIMADGTSWKIDYDSYGNVTHLGLPLGGAIDYTWTTIATANCGGPTSVSRAVATRTISDNNDHTFSWQYNYGSLTNGVLTNSVTDPLGNDTVHVFTALAGNCGFLYETSTRDYQGAVGNAQLLRQVDTGYQTTLDGGSFFVFAASYKTTVYPSGKVKLVQRKPDPGPGAPHQPTYGLVSQELEYDWGQGAPGALLRETDTVYQWQKDSRYLSAHLLDLPASVVVIDPNSANNTKSNCPIDSAGGTRACAAETDYAYDEVGYLQSYEAANGSLPAGTHVAAPNEVRGNLTSVGRWLNTSGTIVVSHTNWFDTGVVYQTIDPLNHTSTQLYDPFYAGAFPTRTCDALNHCVSGTYDFTTGLLTSFSNQNASAIASGNTPGDGAHTTSYGYDSLARITVASFPDGGRVGFNYSAPGVLPAYMEKLKKITADVADDDSFVYLDGLGRPFKGVHKTPTGDVTVKTTYDALDRSINVTNPYLSTTDPTYGIVQTQYDALGRTQQTTKQDGSFSLAVYNQNGTASSGDCTTTTDEAGKVRRTCTDGLDRLVEVDEPGDNFGGTKGNGTLTVSGSLLTTIVPGTNAVKSTGTVTVQGKEQVLNDITPPVRCTFSQRQLGCEDTPGSTTSIPDSGTVSVTVQGTLYKSNFGSNSDAGTIAGDLVNQINTLNPNPYVSAGVTNTVTTSGKVTSATITLTAKNAGSAGNSISYSTNKTWDTAHFASSSFVPTVSSGTLSGGADGTAATTVTDSGTSKATITNQAGAVVFTTAAVPYGGTSPNTNASQVTTALIAALNAPGSPVAASANGSAIAVAYNLVGAAGNATIAVTSTSSQSSYFPVGSFSGSVTLGNGSDPEAPSLDHPFVTQYAYDALGNMICAVQKGMDTTPFTTCSAAPAVWRPRAFSYDSLSRLLTATNPESGTISYGYDDGGNLLQKTAPAANQTGAGTTTLSLCYDDLNRVTGKAYSAQSCQNGQLPAGTALVSYTYDVGANSKGLLSSLTDQAGSSSYGYDALGRMTTEQRTISGISKSVSYDYNLDGSLSVLHYPSGAAVSYVPDSAGRITSVTDSGNGINYVTGVTYAPNGSVSGFISGSNGTFAGITNAFSYNQRLQPVNISAVTPSQQTILSLGYDFHLGNGTSGSDNGNVWAISNGKDLSRSRTFTYDSLNRLASAQTRGTDCSAVLPDGHTKNWGNNYSYDPWGNLLAKTPTTCGSENVSFTMNAKNQPTAYIFDAAGNVTNDGLFIYNYDAENRITGANGFNYTYDAGGNRVKKSNGTTGTLYWYAAVGVIAETDLAGNNLKEYIFFNGTRIARKDPNNQVFYYFSDHLKTASVITDATGNIKSESDYDPWGVERRVVDSFNNTYKFTGKERDGETGLDYFGARYYSSSLGRFMTPDWAAKAVAVPYADYGNPQSLNLYSYVKNNPTTLVDDDGHEDKNQKENVKPQQSGQKKKETKKRPVPLVNVGTAGNPIWQRRPDPGPSGNSNQGGSNQGNSNQGNSNQGNSNLPIIINPDTGRDQNGVCYTPEEIERRKRAIVEKCDAYGCYKAYKDTGVALPHQNRMPSGEPLENAGDGWAHLAWIRSQETHSNEQEHNPDQEQRAPLPENWRDMPIKWPEPWEKTPRL